MTHNSEARTLPAPRPRRRRVLALALGLAALAGLTAVVGANAWAWHQYGAAERALAAHDLDAARAHLAQALRVWPRGAGAHFLAARAARRADAADDAERHLGRAKELGWDAEAVALERALLHAQRDGPGPAEGALIRRVQDGHPDSPLILEALARGYLRTFDLGKGLHCLNVWLEREPDSVAALVQRGVALARIKQTEKAVADLGRAVELRPGHDLARGRLAEVLVEARRFDEAAVHFEALRERQPDSAAALRGLARCRHGQGRADEARRLYDRLLGEQPNDAVALGERGRLALQTETPEEAERWLRRSAALDPHDRTTAYAFAQCLARLGKADEAREWEARLQRIESDLGRVDELNREVLSRPLDPAPRCEAGVIFLRNGREEEGLKWLASALRVGPRHADTHRALADYYERNGDPESAARHRRLTP